MEKTLADSEFAQRLGIESISAASEATEIKFRALLYWKNDYLPSEAEQPPDTQYEINYYRDGRIVLENNPKPKRRRVVLPTEETK